MPITGTDRENVEDLLLHNERNVPALVQLAKSITKNVCDIESAQEALNYVCTHIEDTTALLNKRLVTKEMLFRYLHRQKVPVTADFTKTTLITKVLNYWANRPPPPPAAVQQQALSSCAHNTNPAHQIATMPQQQTVPLTATTPILAEEQFPIHLLARKFTEWFFEQYNSGNLKLADFWQDAHLALRITSNDSVNVSEAAGADAVIQALMQSKQHFDFYFNPNVTHSGVQGRIDAYGLVLVLACGTLHTQQNCVGVFECTFGLMRDPYAENNWKVKRTQCLLRSAAIAHVPNLYESETLREALALPAPMDELT